MEDKFRRPVRPHSTSDETSIMPSAAFKERVREITDFAFRYASDKLPHPNKDSGREAALTYNPKVWEGWKFAQVCIVNDLMEIAEQRSFFQRLQKKARQDHEPDLANYIGTVNKVLGHREAILRTIANGIVWTMYGGRRWVVRALRGRGEPVPVKSIHPGTPIFVDKINSEPDSIAFMTDITSVVGVGDVLVAHLDTEHPENLMPLIVELKSGEVNEYIDSMLGKFGADLARVPPEALDELEKVVGPKGRKHFERLARQEKRVRNFESLANNDIGEDPETGSPMRHTGPEFATYTYDTAFMDMLFSAARSGAEIDCIDGCLWVGVYYSAPRREELLKNFVHEVEGQGERVSSPVWNLAAVSTDSRLQPIFLRDLAPEYTLDIVLGDVQVLVYMDWEAFFSKAVQQGVHARWTTRKERKELTENYYQERAFRSDGRTPVMEKDGAWYGLMGGTVGRIVNEGLSPSCLLEMIEETLDRREFALQGNPERELLLD